MSEVVSLDEVPRPDWPDKDASHHAIASHWLALQGQPEPVGAEGAIWCCGQHGVWERMPLDRVEVQLGAWYTDRKNCRRKADYNAIARHAYDMVADPEYFPAGPVGVAAGDQFHRVDSGQLVCEELRCDHRQRFTLAVEPGDCPTPIWDYYLESAFRDSDPARTSEQQRLAQDVIGAALTGLLPAHEKVVLLYGPGATGKSTLQRIISALVPDAYTTAISPYRWGHDYHLAPLAHARLNLVGELPSDNFIPAADFKDVTGRDLLTARQPYGRVFQFRPSCSHIFSSNHYPSTRDHSSGFWRRWLVLVFGNPVAANDMERDLAADIIRNELPGVLAWALEGAARVVAAGRLTASRASDDALARWRTHTDAVAAFLDDAADIVRDDPGIWTRRSWLYARHREWCADSGRKVMSKTLFFERLDGLGYRTKKRDGYDVVEGIRLLPSEPPL
ncbi:MAG: phage/plasmid primase, P4 family [Gammaproteobacteria bacterium]|nr:phage/plasmid primase, P4 family [Gammaproteobacteria bacterium]